MGNFRLLFVAAIVLALVGCTDNSINFAPGDLDLPPCVERSPVPVEDLGVNRRATCDLAGVEIVFPDGHSEVAPAQGVTTTSGSNLPAEYTLDNLGVYGVVAVLSPGNGDPILWWGTVDGVAMVKRLVGPDGPNRISS
jgi:hypothetical protein